jgi:2-polyprenyl-3-methyl-5-hydroxy-6-metoxy-1,4-benzoquinol methylase
MRRGSSNRVPKGADSPTPTPGAGWLASRPAAMIMSAAPVPLPVLRSFLKCDNARENRRDSWQRLRHDAEQNRYQAVQSVVERYAADGFVVDIGCSQGILQEGLRYRRYLGVDSFADSIRLASAKTDDRTEFVCADAMTFIPDTPADAIVMNEVLYYLPNPLAAVRHHARSLSTEGVIIVSVYAHAWSTRRLLRMIADQLDQVQIEQVASGHLGWSIAVFRPRRS